MTPLLLLGYLFALCAVTLSWALARRRPDHRPLAWLLTFGLSTDVIRQLTQTFLLAPAYQRLAGAPATGWLRALANLEQALFIS